MTVFESQGSPLPYPPPDDKTLPQFVLDGDRPKLKPNIPEYPCLIEEVSGRKVYIDQLRARTEYLARSFSSAYQLGSNDVVTLCSSSHLDYPVCLWAAHRLGCIVAPMSPNLTVNELIHQLRIAKPSIIIVQFETLPVVLKAATALSISQSRIVVIDPSRHERSFVSLDSLIADGATLPAVKEFTLGKGQGKTKIAILIFSSGTTGLPKAVSISHYNMISFLLHSAAYVGAFDPDRPEEHRRYRPGEVVSGVLPLYHIYGLAANLNSSIFLRLTVVISAKFNFETFLQSISRYKINHLLIVPPQGVLLCKHPAAKRVDLSSVQSCMLAGAPATAELIQQLSDRMPGAQLGQAYGLTETTAAFASFPPQLKVGTLGSAGRLMSGCRVKIVKLDGTLAKAGEVGEILVSGGQVALGYYQNEEATKASFVDGWLHTGDLGTIDSQGDLFIVDRLKELIKVKGNQVAPAELEGHLLSHPDVADCGVVGIADAFAGELPLAFIALHPGRYETVKADSRLEAEVRRGIYKHVSDAKSRYKWLDGGIEFVDMIPKNPGGKILRRVLRDRAKAIKTVEKAKL